mgnify:CR=1 FL=1
MRKLAILGSTGSIGTQALDVAARHSDRFAVTALVAHSSSEKLFEQVRQFHPQIAALSVEPKEIPADIRESCQWMFGENVLLDVVRACDADDVLVSVVGVVGLAAVMEALACGKRVLLANKEPLVAGGELVTEAARKAGHPLLPVDSEHSAVFQCLQGAQGNTPIRLILTASGGPFRTLDEFCRRMVPRDLNRRAVESLIKAGAFDSLGFKRRALLTASGPIIDSVTADSRKNIAGQLDLFGMGGDDSESESVRTIPLPDVPEFTRQELMTMERETTGLYLTGHPMDDYRDRAARLRGSVMIIGPLLARYGVGYIPKPGGDKIGRRRLDTHFIGFQKLGAEFDFDTGTNFFSVSGKNLKGCYMLLDEASVTGTANIVMAAVLAKGRTTIYNAACEPYVQQLCRMLNRMGALISGIASNLLVIDGVESLHGTAHTLLPDMIEVGSFIGMAAMTRSRITIKDVSFENLGIIPAQFARMGIEFEQRGDDIYIPRHEHYEIESFIDGSIMNIADAPWPGLTPDLLSVFLVVATQAKGSVLIHQKMFESRLFFVDKLIDMGAQIILCDPHRAVVIGHDRSFQLRGGNMTSPDIRAGIALLIAAMSADGISRIHNIEQIDRGYQNIEQRLNALGARITRI